MLAVRVFRRDFEGRELWLGEEWPVPGGTVVVGEMAESGGGGGRDPE